MRIQRVASLRSAAFHTSASLVVVVGSAPGAPLSQLIGELMKCLTQAFGACVAPMRDARLAASLHHRRNAAERCHFIGVRTAALFCRVKLAVAISSRDSVR